jgi:hypothetical protein
MPAIAAAPVFEQKSHPVIKMIPAEKLLALPREKAAGLLAQREKLIELMETDPLYHGYEPARWREIYLIAARKRLEHPGVPIEGLVSGAIRSGKTTLGGRIHNAHFFNTPAAWTWCFHSTEPSSETIQQPVVYKYLPVQFKTTGVSLRKGKSQKMGYVEGHGFIGDKFTLMGRTCEFLTYKMKIGDLQGSALTFVWADELIPKAFAETIRERLITAAKDTWELLPRVEAAAARLEAGEAPTNEELAAIFHGTALYSFTPRDGWTDIVADFQEGAVTVRSEPAELLERVVNGRRVPQLVPLEKRCKKETRWIAYLHTKDNEVRGNWEGLKKELQGASDERIRVVAYGDLTKSTAGAFPKFNKAAHVVKLEAVPREGTFYQIVDPAGRKNWFALWVMVDAIGRSWVVDEWPRLYDDIPGVGDPGEWAVASRAGKHDGDRGPAQRGFGFSLNDYKLDFLRIERRLGKWFHGGEIAGEGVKAVQIQERHIDSRYAHAETRTADQATTLLEQLDEIGLNYYPAPGEHIEEGVSLINDALAWDDTRPRDVTNEPHLLIVDHCAATIYSLENWTGLDGQKGASKEPIDCLRWHFLSEPEHLTPQSTTITRPKRLY